MHPAMVIILRAESQGSFLGMGGDETAIALRSVLPFGWRSSPCYSASIGDVVRHTHMNFAPRHQRRGGSEYYASQLFVDDAIGIGKELGGRCEGVVS